MDYFEVLEAAILTQPQLICKISTPPANTVVWYGDAIEGEYILKPWVAYDFSVNEYIIGYQAV